MPNESKRYQLEGDRRDVSARGLAGPARGLAIVFTLAFTALIFTSTSVLARAPRPGTFDYYALALSWSPSFCADHGGDPQCAPGRAFAFVVHGLWPQYNKGWPQNCRAGQRRVPEDVIESMLDIMPSKKLIIHEWKKHGTCSGLSVKKYFDSTRDFYRMVRVPARYLSPTADVLTTPEQLVTDFVKTNAGLTSDMLSVQCGNSRGRARLAELRVCLSKAGDFQKCGSNERQSCRAETLVMPKVR
jgi:ribonuclease T2